jgi:type IV fimbrial biogenesis protein FimT
VTNYLQNTQIRNAAESISNGLRLAQTHAIKRNSNVEFILTAASGWRIEDTLLDPEDRKLEEHFWVVGAKNATVTSVPADATTVTFNGLGRVVAVNADGTPPFSTVDVTNELAPHPRPLRVEIGIGSGIKMCDPALVTPDPKAC